MSDKNNYPILNLKKRKARTYDSAEADTILKSISCMTSDINDSVDTAINPDRAAKLRCLGIISEFINTELAETGDQQLKNKQMCILQQLERNL